MNIEPLKLYGKLTLKALKLTIFYKYVPPNIDCIITERFLMAYTSLSDRYIKKR